MGKGIAVLFRQTFLKSVNKRTELQRLLHDVRRDVLVYTMLIPGLAYFIIFHYMPMYGISIAFRDYNLVRGFSDAPWLGLYVFKKIFGMEGFNRALLNNIRISLLKIICGFPMPIILSLMINEINTLLFKKYVQTTVILPHFISWFIIYGMMFALFNLSDGVVPSMLQSLNERLGTHFAVVNYLGQKETIMTLLILSYLWQASGYGTIIYLAAISGIDQQLYEAAMIDGAGKMRQLWHITLAGLRSTIITLLIFRVGGIMNAGFDQVFALSNKLVISEIDIIDTYVYRVGMQEAKYSLATAAGLFKSVIGLVLVLGTNYIAKRVDPDSGIM
jgi:putative aldouronate transport system permease protein